MHSPIMFSIKINLEEEAPNGRGVTSFSVGSSRKYTTAAGGACPNLAHFRQLLLPSPASHVRKIKENDYFCVVSLGV